MRVGIDVSPFVVEPRRGVSRALSALLVGLEDLASGCDVVLFGPQSPLLPEDVRPPSSARIAEVAPVPRAKPPTRAVVTGTPRVHRRRCPALVREHGIDVWYSPWSAFPDVACAVVATVHELPFVRCGPIEGRLRAWRHRRWLARDVRRANRIVVPSTATRDDLLTLHPEAAARVRVVPHGFEAPRVPPTPPAERPALPPRAVVVGARSRRKGMDVWLEARRRLGDAVDWVLVGEPPREVARSVRDDRRVRVVADPTDDVLWSHLRDATLLVYPSLSEGFGFPPLEAMALDVPVVASAAGSIPEVCGDAALLVPPGEPVALADGIRRVLDDGDLRARLVLAGRERARAFSPAVAARRLLAVLEEAAAEGPR